MDTKYLAILTVAILSGCGGGSSSSPTPTPTPAANTGVFIDSSVEGINYSTTTVSGTTNANGEFEYNDGESVIFSIGDINLPAVTAGGVITLLDVVNTQDIYNTSVVNMARLLQSLDTDGDPTNGISISSTAHLSAIGLSVNFASTTFDTDVANLVANSGSVTTSLINEATAISHLQDTLAEFGLLTLVGSWYSNSANKTLVTFIDNNTYYVTQDIDDIGEPLCSDGMESGTYTWDSITGNFSLTNVIDTTGDCGLTSVQGDTYTPISVSISGDILTIVDPAGDIPATRVLDTANPIIGGWYNVGANKTLVTFIDNNTYYVTQDIDDIGEPLCSDGMESGTYTWDSVTGNFSLTNVIDTTGDCGLTSVQGDTYTPISVSISGNILTIVDPAGDIPFDSIK